MGKRVALRRTGFGQERAGIEDARVSLRGAIAAKDCPRASLTDGNAHALVERPELCCWCPAGAQGNCPGYGLIGAHGRRAPAVRGFADNRHEGKALCETVGCRVQMLALYLLVCITGRARSTRCLPAHVGAMWAGDCKVQRCRETITPRRQEDVCRPTAAGVGLLGQRL